ncbi:uncharacterized protein LOC144069096 isoform X1 [Stigmatopora argus]
MCNRRGRGVAVVRVQKTRPHAAIFQNGGWAGGWARWTAELLRIDDFPKKDPTNFFQDNAARSSLNEDRLLGNIKNVAITAKKEQFVGKRFKATEMVEAVQIYKTKEVVCDVGPVFQRFKATKTVEAVQIYKTKEVVYDVHPNQR